MITLLFPFSTVKTGMNSLPSLRYLPLSISGGDTVSLSERKRKSLILARVCACDQPTYNLQPQPVHRNMFATFWLSKYELHKAPIERNMSVS